MKCHCSPFIDGDDDGDSGNKVMMMIVVMMLVKICRASKQYLRLMLRKPVLRIQDINPMLFRYLEELEEVKVHHTSLLSCVYSGQKYLIKLSVCLLSVLV